MTEPKCEACGTLGAATGFIYVRTLNGGLNLCQMCLADINGKNPELKALREAAQAVVEGARTSNCWMSYAAPDARKHLGVPESLIDALASVLNHPRSET